MAKRENSPFRPHAVDDFYFSSSDDEYVQELKFQEIFMSLSRGNQTSQTPVAPSLQRPMTQQENSLFIFSPHAVDGDNGADQVSLSYDKYVPELQFQETLMASRIMASSLLPPRPRPPSPFPYLASHGNQSSQTPVAPSLQRPMTQQKNSLFSFHAMEGDKGVGHVFLSDDKYVPELQFQETLMASRTMASSLLPPPPSPFPCLASHGNQSSQTPVVPSLQTRMTQQENSLFSFHPTDGDKGAGHVSQSDDKYVPELQFQETLTASSLLPPPPSPFPCLASSSKTIEVILSPMKKRKVGLTTVKKAGESSVIICTICAKTERRHEMFSNKRCDHSFCSDCITKQVATKIQDPLTVVPCLGLNFEGVSLLPPRAPPPSPFPCLASSSKTIEVILSPMKKRKVGLTTVKKAGESSVIICTICAKTERRHEMFSNKRCDHSFCSDCITKQVATKIQDPLTVVPCLGLNFEGVSLLPPRAPPPSPFPCLASSSKAIEVSLSPMRKRKVVIICKICGKRKRRDEMLSNKRCDHSFCSDCITKQVATKIQDPITVVPCLGLNCEGVSLLPPRAPPPSPFPCLASSSKAIEVSLSPIKKRKVGLTTVKKAGESSVIICKICAETKRRDEMFSNMRCDHSFCSDCITKQVATKIQDGITVVPCLGLNCKGVLELDACRSMLPKDLIDRWDDAMCEAFLLTAKKFYCPFKDCSAMMLDDKEEGKDITESECPFCHRLFCARCHVPWHHGIGCEEFQKLNKDEAGREDLLVRELANEKKWSRCPKCKFYVEKTGGCLHITCRCKFQFCYACGKQWSLIHSCSKRN